MHCARAGTCQRDHLGALKAPAWLAEEKSEHALLDRREEHVRQSRARRRFNSHIGKDRTRNGKDQAPIVSPDNAPYPRTTPHIPGNGPCPEAMAHIPRQRAVSPDHGSYPGTTLHIPGYGLYPRTTAHIPRQRAISPDHAWYPGITPHIRRQRSIVSRYASYPEIMSRIWRRGLAVESAGQKRGDVLGARPLIWNAWTPTW